MSKKTNELDVEINSVTTDEGEGLGERPETPMTPGSVMGFELLQIDPDVRELPHYVRAAVIDMDCLIPYSKFMVSASEAVFNDWLKAKNVSPLTADDHATMCNSTSREQGIDTVLKSRGIELPWGTAEDAPDTNTIFAFEKLRDAEFLRVVERDFTVFGSTKSFLKELQSNGVTLGIVSRTEHVSLLLEKAKLGYLFQSVVDMRVMWQYRHRAKPSPDSLLRACSDLGVGTGETIAVETTMAGVQAAREGNFGLVIAIKDQHASIQDVASADFVTSDLSSVKLVTLLGWFVKGVQKDSWKVVFNAFNPQLEAQRETLSTVGNGYISSRGCFECYSATSDENGNLVHYPGHYINGCYSKSISSVNYNNKTEPIVNTDLVNCPDWSYIRVSISSGEFFSPLQCEILGYTHQLNLHDAVLERSLTVRDKYGRISRIESSRIVSMETPHLAAIQFTFTPINYGGVITIRTGVDTSVTNDGVARYRGLTSKHLVFKEYGQPRGEGSPFYVLTEVEDPPTGIAISVQQTATLTQGDTTESVHSSGVKLLDGVVSEDFCAYVDSNQSDEHETVLRLDKIITVYCSKDTLESSSEAQAALQRATEEKDSFIAPKKQYQPKLTHHGSSTHLSRIRGSSFTELCPTVAIAAELSKLRHSSDSPAQNGEDLKLAPVPGLSCPSPDYHLTGQYKGLVNVSLYALEDCVSYHRILDPHRQAWHDIWETTDLVIEGDRASQRIARCHIYNLFVSASPHIADIDVGIPARGLHGEAYRGHVFWDELYAFPFYSTSFPEVCRGHLNYRIARLPAARAEAKRLGHRGSMFPWQTAHTGEEVTQEVHFNPFDKKWHSDKSHKQRHVNIAIFYDVYMYQRRTGDRNTKYDELMLSIAVFWGSICKFSDGHYHISDVMGPDEFHDVDLNDNDKGISNNAYTNIMVVWLLETAITIASQVSEETLTAAGVQEGDIAHWSAITTNIFISVDSKGVVQQFDGFFNLEELHLTKYKQTCPDISRIDLIMIADNKVPSEYQILKQADTLLAWHLLSTEAVFNIIKKQASVSLNPTMTPKELLRANFDFYVPRTNDGSALSLLVHAHLAEELGEVTDQWSWWSEASRSDMYNKEGITGEGIHMSVMAGSLSFVSSRFVGLREESKDVWCLIPNLPSHWTSVSLKTKIRGYIYAIKVDTRSIRVCLEGDIREGEEPVTFRVGRSKIQLGPWTPVTIQHDSLCKIAEFYDLMHKTWHHRKMMCNSYFKNSILSDRKQLEILRHVERCLVDIPKNDSGKARLWIGGGSGSSGTRVDCDLSYEIQELRKDICLIERGEEALIESMLKPLEPEFDMWLSKGLAFLQGINFTNWITDRDGTTNNYCGRYNSSVQSVYNSIWITRFALCCRNAVFITSAPLANPGIVNVSVNYETAFVYSGSKGKEYIDKAGFRRTFCITEDEQLKMAKLNQKISELCRLPDYTKFMMIGSGLQLKFAQTTVARQDIYNTIRRKESEAFMATVKGVCEEVSPNGFEIIDTKLDIEIMPLNDSDDKSRGFDKGDGLNWLSDELHLNLDSGPVLVTGDTSGDLPMVREAMNKNPTGTYVIFVTEDKELQKKVTNLCPRSLFLPTPDILCHVLSEAAKIRVRSEYPNQHNRLFPL
eukprot:TRINITY_DN1248_c2_g1_i1.p1 TRINITY_DN1248_c2_g1~~TRINITY_DN1248_c2_g1_i1.p1  ORF type:complete len:1629 (+),score=266.17 TRINITY_DN1248_c2_g1_i1:124-5010(+)